MKEVIVFGAHGMLGRTLCDYLTRQDCMVKALDKEDYNILEGSGEELNDLISSSAVVVNCAAIIQTTLELAGLEVLNRVNSLFPINLARLCRTRNIPCIHISTDGVFSGKKGNYIETDFIDCLDPYGYSKACGESIDGMVIRTSIVGEERGTCNSLFEWARSQRGKELSGFVNHFWNGMTTLQLAETLFSIVERGFYARGIYHLFSERIISKYELLRSINEIYNLDLLIHEKKNALPCNRSLSTIHSLVKNIEIEGIEQQLEKMHRFFSDASD